MTENNLTWHGTTILSVRKMVKSLLRGMAKSLLGTPLLKARQTSYVVFLQALLLLASLALLQMLLHYLNDSKPN